MPDKEVDTVEIIKEYFCRDCDQYIRIEMSKSGFGFRLIVYDERCAKCKEKRRIEQEGAW